MSVPPDKLMELMRGSQASEILQMLQTLPQAGGATPEGRAMAQAPIPGMPQPGGMPPSPPM